MKTSNMTITYVNETAPEIPVKNS